MEGAYLAIKDELRLEDLLSVHPNLLILLGAFSLYANQNGKLPVTITSIRDHAKGRTSTSHRTGRAIDISSRSWPNDKIKGVCDMLNKKYKDIAAISKSDNKPRACVYHKVKDGVLHFHLQVRY
jgi:hypothetical protein